MRIRVRQCRIVDRHQCITVGQYENRRIVAVVVDEGDVQIGMVPALVLVIAAAAVRLALLIECHDVADTAVPNRIVRHRNAFAIDREVDQLGSRRTVGGDGIGILH